jgi:hypothetical protein
LIPTILLPALIVGRWWVIPALAAAWPLMLVGVRGCSLECYASGALLAALNALFGVVFHRSVRLALRFFL